VAGLLATFLLFSIASALALAFAPARQRRMCKRALLAALFVAWIAVGAALAKIVARTASTLVTPLGPRHGPLVDQAAREAATLLLSLGGPALVATIIGWLALRASRRKEA
jgi:MFS family permease